MTALDLVASVAVAIGLAGTLVPLLPGLGLIWGAMLCFGLVGGFGGVGAAVMIAATGLLALGIYLGVRIPQRAAADVGLTRADQLAGLLAAIIGFFVIPVLGLAVGFVLGVFAMHLRRSRETSAAWRASWRAVAALIKASFAQFLTGTAMAFGFAVWVLLT